MSMLEALSDDVLNKETLTGKLVMCGTGHRMDKLGGYGPSVFQRLVSLAGLALLEHKPQVLISGMANGWDQALAQAATNLSIPWVGAIPFTGQEYKWPKRSQKTYLALLEQAEFSIIICEGGYSAEKMQERNRWMVDRSARVLALWNGSNGGTFNCLRYAWKRRVPWTNYWKAWEDLK